MKRLLASLFLTFAVILGVQSQMLPHVLIYGWVTDATNQLPWAHHNVIISSDTIVSPGFNFTTTVHTNINGYYSRMVILPANVSTVGFVVGTMDCNQVLNGVNSVVNGDSLEVNFSLCTGQTPPPPPPCHALFTFHGCLANSTVNFHNISTGFPATYLWSFGDGDTSTAIDPSHTYAQAGIYTVCLVMSNLNGCVDTLCQQVTVNAGTPPPPPPPSVTCHNKFKAMVQGLVVSFHSRAWGMGPFTYAWDFGDGDTSSQQHPVHTYATAGTYTVTLTTTSDSCSYTSTKVFTLTMPDPGPFDINGSVFAGNQTVAGAKVILFNLVFGTGLQAIDSTFTDSLGYFQFLQLPIGNYNLRAFPTVGLDTLFVPTFFVHSFHLGPAHNPYNIYLKHKHLHPFNGMNSQDFDSQSAHSVKSVNVQTGLTIEKAYPNPAHSEVNLVVNMNQSAQVEIAWFNMMGQKAISQTLTLESGNNTLNLPTGNLATGLYTIKVLTGDGSVATQKVSIVR